MDIEVAIKLVIWIMGIGVAGIIVAVVMEWLQKAKAWQLLMKIFPTVVAVGAILFSWLITKV